MYKTIELLKPYFFSLREIKGNLSLDIKIPSKWTYNKIVTKYKTINVKEQDNNNESCLISIVSTSDQIGCDTICACSMEIIKINKENEEKERLYQQKVAELQSLFINKSLEELKHLNFVKENEDGDREGSGNPEERTGFISEGNTESQEQDDTGIKINRQRTDV